jgi:ABC-type molybdate transport system ATPase subunit
MYVRLAFATAIHVDPDVLIVDEALAVGDAIFANRCLQKLEELKNRDVTILFVSHDLGLVKRLCHRAILMMKGEILCQGAPSEVVNRYVALVHDRNAERAEKSDLTGNYRHGDRASTVQSIRILDAAGAETSAVPAGEDIFIEVTAKFHRPVAKPMIGMLIRNRLGVEVFGTNTKIENVDLGSFASGDSVTVRFGFRCFLTRQEYTLTVATQHESGASQDWLDDALQFTVIDERDTAGIASFRTNVAYEVTRAAS